MCLTSICSPCNLCEYCLTVKQSWLNFYKKDAVVKYIMEILNFMSFILFYNICLNFKALKKNLAFSKFIYPEKSSPPCPPPSQHATEQCNWELLNISLVITFSHLWMMELIATFTYIDHKIIGIATKDKSVNLMYL